MTTVVTTGHSRRGVPRFRPALLAPRHWPAWLGAGLLSLLLLLPRGLRDRLGAAIGDWNYRRAKRRTEIGRTNLRICFPELDESAREDLLREHYRAFGRMLLDLPILWWDSRHRVPARLCRLHGLEHIRDVLATRRSVILLTPHTVAVDFGGIALSLHFSMSTMMNLTGHPVADWLLSHSRASTGGLVFARSDGLRPVLRALRAGTVFYYMPDEDLGERDSVFAPFFGHSKATLTTLGRLARAGDAAVVPVMAFYAPEHRHYEVQVLPALEDFPSGDEVTDATAMNRALEQAIRHRPEAYLWTQRIFLTRPAGESSPYPRKKKRNSQAA